MGSSGHCRGWWTVWGTREGCIPGACSKTNTATEGGDTMPVPESGLTLLTVCCPQRKEKFTMKSLSTEVDGPFSRAFTMTLVCKTKRLVVETEFDQPPCAEESQQAVWWLLALPLAPGPGRFWNNSKQRRKNFECFCSPCAVYTLLD